MSFLTEPFFVLRPFFEWATRYPVLCAITAGLLAIIGGFDGGLGLRFLFLNDAPFIALFAGVATGAFFFEICFVAYLLDSEARWMLPDPVTDAGLNRNRVRYLTITVTALSVTAVVLAVTGKSGGSPVKFVAGLIAAVVVIAAFSLMLTNWIDQCSTRSLNRIWPAASRSNSILAKCLSLFVRSPDSPLLQKIHLRAFLVNGLIAVLYCLMVLLRPTFIFAGVAICFLLGLIAAIYGYLRFHFPERHFGVLLLLVAFVTFRAGSTPYLHRFPGFSGNDYANPVSLENVDDPNPNLLQDGETLIKWKTVAQESGSAEAPNSSDLTQLPKLIIVSTSGGGIRAGVWTAAVLTTIEQQIGDFPRHLRLVTGASGGMYGASYYVQTLNPPGAEKTHQVPLEEIVSRVAEDCLDPVAREFVLSDVPHYLLGATGSIAHFDRGTALEHAWQDHTRFDDSGKPQGFSVPFASLAGGERDGWRPSLIVSPMMSDDGRRLLFSNLDLKHITRATGSVIGNQRDVYSVNAIEFFKLFPKVDIPLSTAVRMNASFPYISPDGTLPTEPVRRIVDAGYYDNYGVNVAAAWLFQWKTWLAQYTSGVLLIQIRDAETETWRKEPAATPSAARDRLSRGLTWLTTPVTAVLSARNSTNSFRNDHQLESLQHVLQNSRTRAWKKALENESRQPECIKLNPGQIKDVLSFFATTSLELNEDVSLSWTLTAGEITAIEEAAKRDQIRMRIDEIDQWLHQQ